MGGKKRPAGRPADLPAEKIQGFGIPKLEIINQRNKFYIRYREGNNHWGQKRPAGRPADLPAANFRKGSPLHFAVSWTSGSKGRKKEGRNSNTTAI